MRFLVVMALLSGLAGCSPEASSEERPSDSSPAVQADVPASPDPGSTAPGPGDAGPGDPADSAGPSEVASGPSADAESGPEDAADAVATAEAGRDLAGGAQARATEDPVAERASPDGYRPSFERPEHVRGIYLNAWASGSSRRVEEWIRVARETEVNAFVIDIKDATGYVSHRTAVPLAREIGADQEIRIRDLPGLLERLEAEGIWPIARIVIVKDPILVEARPDMAVQDTAGGVWVDGKGIRWLNPFHPEVTDYHLALAREVVEMGFPEVQWDYVRFPDAPRRELERAHYPGRDGQRRPDAIRAFLAESRRVLGDSLGAVVTADVFGVTTTANDVGIGQIWEGFIDVVDVALPMVYPSHYWKGSYGIDEPNAHPYTVVREALEDALRRSDAVEGAGATRPWLQDFTLGPPAYGAPEVRAQIQATYDVGIDEWILWNPSSRYTVEALEPAGGWAEEPRIRVAGRIVPVSEREEAIRLAEAELADPENVVPPAEVREELPARDTLGTAQDSVPADSSRVRRPASGGDA